MEQLVDEGHQGDHGLLQLEPEAEVYRAPLQKGQEGEVLLQSVQEEEASLPMVL